MGWWGHAGGHRQRMASGALVVANGIRAGRRNIFFFLAVRLSDKLRALDLRSSTQSDHPLTLPPPTPTPVTKLTLIPKRSFNPTNTQKLIFIILNHQLSYRSHLHYLAYYRGT